MTACHKIQNRNICRDANIRPVTKAKPFPFQIKMSDDVEAVMQAAADAAGGVLSSLGKRTNDGAGIEGESEPKTFRTEGPSQTSVPPITIAPTTTTPTTDTAPTTTAVTTPAPATATTTTTVDEDDLEAAEDLKDIDRPPMTKAREVRLDQNRKAARDSRRRKKVMIEELQRSVIFFSRANGTLKQQNDELSRLFMQAQNQAAAVDSTGTSVVQPAEQTQPIASAAATATQVVVKAEGDQASNSFQQAQAQAVATQAMFESQGFPAAAARAAAQTMNASAPSVDPATAPAPAISQPSLPPMQPGATMQAMANFQQAAAAAMQAAIQGMQGIPGVNMNQLAATPVGANPQQAYTDTMTALAMQQAAAAAAAGGSQQFVMQPGMQFMAHPMIAWQQQQQQQAQQQQPPPQIVQQAAAAPAPEPPKQD
jgi:hypothetical protein